MEEFRRIARMRDLANQELNEEAQLRMGRRYSPVTIETDWVDDDEVHFKVNWAGMGAVTPDEALVFSIILNKAIALASRLEMEVN